MKKLLTEYWIELIAVSIAIIGIYYVIVKPQIEFSLLSFISWGVALFTQAKFLISNFLNLNILDLLDLLIVCLCILIIIWRFRVRLLKSKQWNATVCPRCGNRLIRVHRSRVDHLLSHTLLPHARRYRCSNPACKWIGLRSLRYKDPIRNEEPSVLPDHTR